LGFRANTQPVVSDMQAATDIGDVRVPLLVVTRTEVGQLSFGHHAKYQPF
jgi:hypothetical protein